MATIRVMSDLGPVFYDAATNTCYSRVGEEPSPGVPNHTPGEGSITNINAVSFSYPDGGSSSWSACRHGIGMYVLSDLYAGDLSTSYYGYAHNSLPFTAPYAGEMRIWVTPRPAGFIHKGSSWYVNDVYIKGTDTSSHYASISRSLSLLLAAGDVVTASYGSYGTPLFLFTPHTYP